MPATPFNAGLPPQGASAGNLPIGASLMFPTSGDEPITLDDGSVWLRSGVIALKAGYPAASRLEHLRAHVFSASTGVVPTGTPTRMATNGSGVYVLLDGDATDVRVSTDYGKTWANAAHGMPMAPTDIVWNGSIFLLVGSSGTSFGVSTSSNGTTWTGYTAVSGLSTTSAGARACWNGSVFNIVASGNTTECCWSSPTGLTGTWTSRTMPSPSVTANFGLSATPNGNVLIVTSNSTTAFKSSNGTVFSSLTLPVNAQSACNPPTVGNLFMVFAGNSTYVTTSDLTNFSGQISLSNSVPSGVFTSQNLWSQINGRTVFATSFGNSFAYTADGLTWNIQSCDIPSFSGGVFAGDVNSLVAAVGSVTAPRYAASSLDNANAVGRAITTGAGGIAMNIQMSYYRVK